MSGWLRPLNLLKSSLRALFQTSSAPLSSLHSTLLCIALHITWSVPPSCSSRGAMTLTWSMLSFLYMYSHPSLLPSSVLFTNKVREKICSMFSPLSKSPIRYCLSKWKTAVFTSAVLAPGASSKVNKMEINSKIRGINVLVYLNRYK